MLLHKVGICDLDILLEKDLYTRASKFLSVCEKMDLDKFITPKDIVRVNKCCYESCH